MRKSKVKTWENQLEFLTAPNGSYHQRPYSRVHDLRPWPAPTNCPKSGLDFISRITCHSCVTICYKYNSVGSFGRDLWYVNFDCRVKLESCGPTSSNLLKLLRLHTHRIIIRIWKDLLLSIHLLHWDLIHWNPKWKDSEKVQFVAHVAWRIRSFWAACRRSSYQCILGAACWAAYAACLAARCRRIWLLVSRPWPILGPRTSRYTTIEVFNALEASSNQGLFWSILDPIPPSNEWSCRRPNVAEDSVRFPMRVGLVGNGDHFAESLQPKLVNHWWTNWSIWERIRTRSIPFHTSSLFQLLSRFLVGQSLVQRSQHCFDKPYFLSCYPHQTSCRFTSILAPLFEPQCEPAKFRQTSQNCQRQYESSTIPWVKCHISRFQHQSW